jgi:hypothetical protein
MSAIDSTIHTAFFSADYEPISTTTLNTFKIPFDATFESPYN